MTENPDDTSQEMDEEQRRQVGLAGLYECVAIERAALEQAKQKAGGDLTDRYVGWGVERYRRACLALAPFETPRVRARAKDKDAQPRDLDAALQDKEQLEKMRDLIQAALDGFEEPLDEA